MRGVYTDEEVAEYLRISGFHQAADVIDRLLTELADERRRHKQIEQFSVENEDLRDELDCLADAVDALRRIGQIVGCDHVGDAFGRAKLVRCVREEFERLSEGREANR